jgi:flagellar export protein FliJ
VDLMSKHRGQWLGSLLRARQIQEDAARERLVHAHLHAEGTRRTARNDDQRVQAMLEQSSPESALAFVAAVSARQAAAATLAAALHTQAMAEDQVANRRSSLTTAAQHRLSAEKLIERDASERRRSAASAMQQELDEIGSRMHRDKAVGR